MFKRCWAVTSVNLVNKFTCKKTNFMYCTNQFHVLIDDACLNQCLNCLFKYVVCFFKIHELKKVLYCQNKFYILKHYLDLTSSYQSFSNFLFLFLVFLNTVCLYSF